MRRPWAFILLGVLVACGPETRAGAQAFAVPALLKAAREAQRVGGIDASLLVVPSGRPIAFRGPPAEPGPVLHGEKDALCIVPAFKEGKPSAFFVTEVWDAHPTPWVQPVYVVRTSAPMPLLRVFNVDDRSTFYSPFWEEVIATVPDDADPEQFASSQAVLSGATLVRRARLFFYPIVTEAGVELAGSPAVVRPYSLQPVTTLVPVMKARVDGASVSYLQIATERFSMSDQLPTESVIYDFVSNAQTEPFALPPVLASTAKTEALSRRVRVYLPAQARAFLPAGWEELGQLLAVKGFTATEVGAPELDPAIARDYALRVASDPACFSKPALFPQGCRWLDSQAALRADRRLTFEPTQTVISVLEVDLKAP